MEDTAIIALYWSRDEAAIAETDKKYGPYCRAIAQNILTIREDAEECVSDSYHRAWNAMPPQRPDSLPPFLGRIVRNLSISRWRRERAQKRYAGLESLLSGLEECLPDPKGVEEAVEGRELTHRIEVWLESLPQDDRAVFLRRYWYGQEVQAMARAWGVSPNQMAKRLQRLRKSLKRDLEQEGFTV